MNIKSGMLSMAMLASLSGAAVAAPVTYTWDFAANQSCTAVPGNPVQLCDSDYNASTVVFAATTDNALKITARGYDLGATTSPTVLHVGTTIWTNPVTTPDKLWAKFNGSNLGADETGLGLNTPDGSDHEINKNNFIQLDLSALPANALSVDLKISSLQAGETATIWGSTTLGQPGTLLAEFTGPGAGGAAVTTFHYDLSKGRFLTVSSDPNVTNSNDVLIESGFLVTFKGPEPGTMALFGAGLAGAIAFRRRKKKAA
jgi:hypothetical protein